MGLTEGREDLHADLRDGVRRVCSKFDDAYWRDCDENHEFPWAFYETLAEGGWIGIAIPEQFGGGGQGITEASILLEEIAASGAAMNGSSAIHLSIFGMNPVVKHGSDAMREKYLPKVVDGSLHVAFGVTEPDAGTDTTSITTSARKVDGGYLVRGRKVWTTKALYAQKVLLLVRTTPQDQCAKRTDGMTLLLADLQRPEVDIRPIPKAGRNAVVSCEVRYDDLFVEEADRVGEEGRGFHYLLDGLNPERILVAGESIGIGRAAIAKAVSYAKDRVVFGRPIGQNQGIAFPLAECYARLHAAEYVVRDASARYDAGQPCAEQANIAKFLAADAAFNAADQAMQTLGGMGYAKEYDVERYWR
ncbi:MAG: acyl-CoA/acyl-ACP dehydrogenase, partial [Actinobacteria bacterium]|nr:acyl-CoA/acyl-ACP dehydrogenase [Actinomycetota bacterium]